nr:LytTR family DNA-binding domain-containing protein [uncultured Marinifilum sp.]
MNTTKENTYTCLIVEDEPLSQEILEAYIKDCPQLILIDICKDAIEANTILLDKKIDLIFLDINMPKLNGVEWLKSLDELPKVIFTTAYPEYAVEGFNLNVLDYLLKPFSFNRFLKSVNKFLSLQKNITNKTFVVKSNKKSYIIKTSELNYIESDGDYLKLYRDEDCIVVHDTLKSFRMKLSGSEFLRVHRSFIINISKIAYIENNQVCVNKKMIPVANSYRDELKSAIEK